MLIGLSQQSGHEMALAESFKNHKNAFLNDPKTQKEVFGHFLKFCLLDPLDIASCDCTKCFPTFLVVTDHEGSFQNLKNVFLNDPKAEKGVFGAMFWS